MAVQRHFRDTAACCARSTIRWPWRRVNAVRRSPSLGGRQRQREREATTKIGGARGLGEGRTWPKRSRAGAPNGKPIEGSKRHIVVDRQGSMLGAVASGRYAGP
jgi:hypothetical protein